MLLASTPPPNSPKPPTKAQIRADVAKAVRSRSLWATVNICNTKRHRDVIGIRGQMPALGFPAKLEMTIRLRYQPAPGYAFKPLPGVVQQIPLGTLTYGTIQDGATFAFKPPVVLSGAVTFQWTYRHKLLATVTKQTTAHVKGVDQSDPAGYSAASCTIARS